MWTLTILLRKWKLSLPNDEIKRTEMKGCQEKRCDEKEGKLFDACTCSHVRFKVSLLASSKIVLIYVLFFTILE